MQEHPVNATQTRGTVGRRCGTTDTANARESMNQLCAACSHTCKQAAFCVVVACAKYRP